MCVREEAIVRESTFYNRAEMSEGNCCCDDGDSDVGVSAALLYRISVQSI